MDERVTCKLCGHDRDAHRFADPPRCAKCQGGVCQRGPQTEPYVFGAASPDGYESNPMTGAH